MKRFVLKPALALLLLAMLALPLAAQDVASFEKRVTVKKLANGLTIVICERHEAPVFSFYTLVDVGSAQDPMGQTGMAHMFEHMAFKGTDFIGTKNYAAEKPVLEKIERTYAAYMVESRKKVGRDEKKLEELRKAWQKAVDEADKFVVKNEFPEIVEKSGGADLNASTSTDQTEFHYSMPVNRLEMWAYLESSRYSKPVIRDFYKERDVVIEERRMRTESNPQGRLIEEFMSTAFTANPYHRPTIGYMDDLHQFSATDAKNFFDTYYVPSNMVIALVGDLTPAQVMPIVEKYFGKLPARPKPVDIATEEPKQIAERRIVLKEMSQPVYAEGYQRPNYKHADDAVYDVIADLLSSGRTSRLYRSLVRDKKLAMGVEGGSGFPGNKYTNLFYFFGMPMPGHSLDELANGIHGELDRLKNEDITDDELKAVKTRVKVGLLGSLGSNSGLAAALATVQTRYGDWRELFKSVEKIDQVTKADVRRVASSTFAPTNRTVAVIENAKSAKGAK